VGLRFWQATDSGQYFADSKQQTDTSREVSAAEYFKAKHPDLYVYDIETYPNAFTCTVCRVSDDAVWRFEISNRRNDGVGFFQFLTQVRHSGGRLVGYNNIHFDYPVIHLLITKSGHISVGELYQKAKDIIKSKDRFANMIWESDRYIPQVDLFKIHHFDNNARSTSLKLLEFNMQSENIQDLPFEPGLNLTDDQIDTLIEYNDHDVLETVKFLYQSIKLLEFRDELSEKYDRNFTNHNDTKIGKDYFIMQLERQGVACYHRRNRRRQPIQSARESIRLGDVIFPWLQFKNAEFQRVLDWLKAQTITETKGVFKNLHCNVNGFQFDFGTGGIHGSIESQIVASDDDYIVIDLDVASYYPNLAIINDLYPEHLGRGFCDIYKDVYNQRKQFAKGTPENAMLKLALNGVYGDSNNEYSPFYDPAYTMSITINGQLLLCVLSEYLLTIRDLQMIQVNTDGLTVRLPRSEVNALLFIVDTWEQLTGLKLERADYRRMMIFHINGYIAEYDSGELKRKGCYCYGGDLDWHQNYSQQIVAIAAEAALVHNIPVEQTIADRAGDIMLFMKRTKVRRSDKLVITTEDSEEQLQNITRYLVTNTGGSLVKIMPPTEGQLKKSPTAPDRRVRIDAGWTVTPCNDLKDKTNYDINYDYYIKEAKKLVDPLTRGAGLG